MQNLLIFPVSAISHRCRDPSNSTAQCLHFSAKFYLEARSGEQGERISSVSRHLRISMTSLLDRYAMPMRLAREHTWKVDIIGPAALHLKKVKS